MSRKTILTLLAGASLCLSASAADVEMCYSDLNIAPEWFGTGKSETYDVAIKVVDPGMVGAKVTGVKVPIRNVDHISNISGWLSKELKLASVDGKKVNVPDICSAEMAYNDGWLTATFDTPYEITTDGVYVGYTFTVDNVSTDEDKMPVAVSEGTDVNSFFIHTTKQYLKWRENSSEKKQKTYITVLVDGNFTDVGSGLVIEDNLYYKAGEPSFSVPVEMVVHGSASLSSIDFSYDFSDTEGNNFKGTVTKTFETPAEVQFGHSYFTDVEIPEVLPKGIYSGTLTVDAINGNPNHDSAATASFGFETLSRVPIHKPVMEEYTGLWCGFCPRGYASLEHMRHNYPNDFIGISYHNGDEMTVLSTSQYPSKVSGFPAAYLDRGSSTIDAYHGTSGEGYGFKNDWLAKRAKFTPADIRVKAYFAEGDNSTIHVESEFTCVKDTRTGFKIAYVLIADGLYDNRWLQANNYAGNGAYRDIPEMDVFIDTYSSFVGGLTFNDIYVASSPLTGIDDSIPWPVETDVTYNNEYTFNASTCKTVYGKNPIQHLDKLRVAALVINSFGEIENADACDVTTNSGVYAVTDNAEVVNTEYYDIYGLRVNSPANGLYIKVETLSNGAQNATKVFIP